MNLFTAFLSQPMLFNIIVFMNSLLAVYEFLQAMTDLMTTLFVHAQAKANAKENLKVHSR